jgi:ankyrin repeat protein
MIKACRVVLSLACLALPVGSLHAQAVVIEAKPAPQTPGVSKYPMYEAAKKGDVAAIERLARQGSSVDFVCDSCWSPLVAASFYGQIDAVRALLRLGADPRRATSKGDTALHRAAGIGNLEITRLLIEAGAYVNAIDGDGRTPLDRAAVNGRREVIQELLAHKAGPKLDDAIWLSSLCWVIGKEDIETLRLLLPLGKKPLRDAVAAQSPRNSPEARSSACNPLHYAMALEDPAFTRLLLEAGEDPEETVAGTDRKLVMRAVCESPSSAQQAKLKLLLEHGAKELDQKNDKGQTALLCAAEDDEVETMRLLLQAGADPNIADNSGMTALDYALKERSEKALDLLLAKGVAVKPSARVLEAASYPSRLGASLVTALQPYFEQEARQKCPKPAVQEPRRGVVNKTERGFNSLKSEDFTLAQLEMLGPYAQPEKNHAQVWRRPEDRPCPARNEAGEILPYNYRAEDRDYDRDFSWSADGAFKYEMVVEGERYYLAATRRGGGKQERLVAHSTKWIKDSLKAEFGDMAKIGLMAEAKTPEQREKAAQYLAEALKKVEQTPYGYKVGFFTPAQDGRYLFYTLKPDMGGWFGIGKQARHFVVDLQARPVQVWRIDADVTDVRWDPNARDLYLVVQEQYDETKHQSVHDARPSYRAVTRFP